MTREEAIELLEKEKAYMLGHGGDRQAVALDMAIKALEQESVLDEIKDEIANDWRLNMFPSIPFSCGLRRAIEIIDKYKSESESK